MSRILLSIVLVAALAVGSLAAENEKVDKHWLDMQNCAICKSMGANMDMMKQVKWESHKISNGMLSAAVVPKELQPKMEECHRKMEAAIARLEKGEQLPLCGMCESYGELVQAGAKSEDIKTDFGMIGLLTSNDPEVVKKIHAHADKTVSEYKEFLQKQGQ